MVVKEQQSLELSCMIFMQFAFHVCFLRIFKKKYSFDVRIWQNRYFSREYHVEYLRLPKRCYVFWTNSKDMTVYLQKNVRDAILFFTRISCEISQICKILLSLLSKIQVQRKLRLAWCGIYSIFCSKFLVWNTNILQSINDTCTCNIIYVALLSFITKTSWILHVYTWHVHVFI